MHKSIFPVSLLYTPGMNVKNIFKAFDLGADVCVFDLEDSVPDDSKSSVREHLRNYLSNTKYNIYKAVRINSIRCRDGLEDILFFIKNKVSPDIIIMTMINSHEEVLILKELLYESNLHSKVYVTIETTKALSNIQKIASSCDGLILGSADLAAFLKVDITWENMLYARQVIVNAAATYDISAIDTACYKLSGNEELKAECYRVKELGFHGKVAIHPQQIKTINHIFYPDKNTMVRASEIVSKFSENNNRIINLDGQMIGPPFVAKARWLLERYGPGFDKKFDLGE